MGGYLDTYGAGVDRKLSIFRRVALWVLLVLSAAGLFKFTTTFIIPNRVEQRVAGDFFALLQSKQYQKAYEAWGCTAAKPCRGYDFAHFMGDWGPQAGPVDTYTVLDGETCGSGVIVDVDAGKAGDKRLWVERADRSLSFLPPGPGRCQQGNRIYDFFRDIRYKLRGRTYQ